MEIMPAFVTEIEKLKTAIRTGNIVKDSRKAREENGVTIFEDITIYPLIANEIEGAVIRVDDVTDRVES